MKNTCAKTKRVYWMIFPAVVLAVAVWLLMGGAGDGDKDDVRVEASSAGGAPLRVKSGTGKEFGGKPSVGAVGEPASGVFTVPPNGVMQGRAGRVPAELAGVAGEAAGGVVPVSPVPAQQPLPPWTEVVENPQLASPGSSR